MNPARFTWTDAAVRRALGLEELEAADVPAHGGPSVGDRTFTGVSTDTRALEPGVLFVALEGTNFDGHDFLEEAASQGAAAAVISRGLEGEPPLPIYPVPDTLVALGHLGRYRRRALHATVVALTGSSGKTTVKDLLRAALSSKFRVHATKGNLNNRVGLPLTLLATPDDAEVVVVELGTNEPGEIGILTRIAEPDMGMVTTVSEAHLEGLGSLGGVLDEKLSLLSELRPGAPSLVGDTPPELPGRARQVRDDVQVAGFTTRSDLALRGEALAQDDRGRVPFRFRGTEVHPRLPGRHGAMNVLLAMAVAYLLDVPLDRAVPALEAVDPPPLRGEVRSVGGLTLLLDCYNANPQSVRAALEWLTSLPEAEPRVAVLGSMLELGKRGAALHRDVLEHALRLPVSLVVGIGAFAEAAEGLDAGDRLVTATMTEEVWDVLAPRLRGDETVLLKGSRGMALERLLPRFEQTFGEGAGERERD